MEVRIGGGNRSLEYQYIREVGTGPWDKGGGNRRIGRGMGRVTALSRCNYLANPYYYLCDS